MTTQKLNLKTNLQVKVPFYNKKFIDILETKYTYDRDATEDARNYYSKYKSKKEIEDLNVYSIEIKYSIRKKLNILFKPCISFSYDGAEKISSPAFPLVVFYNELG